MLIHSFIEEHQVSIRAVVVCYLQVHDLHIQAQIESYIKTFMHYFPLQMK